MYSPFKFQAVNLGKKYTVVDVDFHRNGIGGEGFMTGVFSVNSKAESERGIFLFTLFPSWSGEGKEETFDECTGDFRCAVLRIGDLPSQSAWRGDYFYTEIVQKAVKEWQRQYDVHFKVGE